MKYQVVVDDSLADLIAKVNAAIASGWQPAGGIAVGVRSDDKVGYFQAMLHE